ncbi:MAG: DNA-formamidopyrimidine glycosylase family protein [Polyangiales bacterium]
MPELAEVQRQVTWLRERVTGGAITAFGYTGGHFAAYKADPNKAAILGGFFEGATLEDVTQRGKHVVMRLSTGTATSHLMHKGRWSIEGDDFTSPYKHHHDPPEAKSASFWMVVGGKKLRFHEPEYRGKVSAFPGMEPGEVPELTELGPDVVITEVTDPAFRTEWTVDALRAVCAKTKGPIKALLLEQKRQAGIGNMYACEALYLAEVAPERPASSLSADETARVHRAVQAVIGEAIASGLDYAKVLKVYRKETDPKGNAVQADVVKGRDTFWVPAVQR